jgi:serine/threonine protein phosphatase 1
LGQIEGSGIFTFESDSLILARAKMQNSALRFARPFDQGRGPSLPEGLRMYVVGDIHGRADLLDELFSLIDADLVRHKSARAVHVFLGDYIDRGEFSRGTIDRLIQRGSTHECVFLKGNHELIAVGCLTDKASIPTWIRLGGAQTLLSYGVRPSLRLTPSELGAIQIGFQNALPRAHLQFLARLQVQFSVGDYFFAHAGVKPGVPLSKQKEKDLLWIRDEFLSSTRSYGKIVVHGHTPTIEVEFRTNRINIDTGAYLTNRLTCLVLENNQILLIQTGNSEFVRSTPQ